MTRSTSYAIPAHHEPPSSNPSAYHNPLLLVPFPRRSRSDDHDDNDGPTEFDILAYGGDDGCIYLLPAEGEQETPRAIRKYDDCVRALAVSVDGKRVAVGFDDGSTKIYRYDDDHGAFSNEGRHAFIPKEETSSQSFSQFDDGDDGNCFAGPRLQSPVRQMAFDPRPSSEYFLAIVSEDGDSPLVICAAASAETFHRLLLAHDSAQEHNGGGARSLAYSPPSPNAKPMLSTLGMDGQFLVWTVDTPTFDPTLDWEIIHRDAFSAVKVDPGEGMGSDAADRACRVVWGQVDGKTVCLLPGKTHVQFRYGEESHMLQRQKFVMDGGHKDTIVTMAWEPRGKRFVSGGRDGKLFLWEMALEGNEILGQLVGEVPIQKGACVGIPPITSIVWTEKGIIYAADASGVVYLVSANDGDYKRNNDNVGTRATENIDESNKLVTQPDEVEKAPHKQSGLRRLNKKAVKKLSDDDDDDVMFDEDAKKLTTEDRTTRAEKISDASKFIEDEAEDAADDDEATVDIHAPNVEPHPPSRAKDDIIYDDIDTNLLPQDNADLEEGIFQTHQDPIDRDLDYTNHQTTSSFPPLQPAFAPSSTPVSEPRRILCWNHIGVVTTYPDPDSQYNLVDVAFHETAGLVGGRRPINFTDNLGFIVGTLGEEGALFASDLMEEEDDDDLDDEDFHDLGVMSEAARKAVKLSRRKKKREDSGKGSHVYFNRFETFGRNADKDWVVALPDGERVMGCAAGRGWCSVISSRRYLRLFTTTGIQGPVIWLPGEPVTIIGRDRFVAVFYHRSATPMQDGTQLLGYSIMDGIKGTTVACGDVSALSPGASLTWAGFTEVCALSVMDSEGVLSILARQSPTDAGNIGGNWVPMLDTEGHKKSTNDTYWPVEVHGGKLVCVLLRGGKEYPDAGRRPVTTTLSLRMPLAGGLTKCGQVEELSVRGKIALEQKKVLNDYSIAQGEGNINDAEDEYIQLSAQIDKVTLKLFNEIIKSGKVERALSLVHRLHLEKSYDIAIQVSDRMGHRKLSDFIEDAKLLRFPAVEDDDFFDDGNSFCSRQKSDSFDEASTTLDRGDQREVRGISPEIHTPKGRHSREVQCELTDEESPPRSRASLKRQLEDDHVVPQTKRLNPFAKKRMESPAKGIIKTPQSPAKLTLSRQSTFSAKSRQKQRSGKQIV